MTRRIKSLLAVLVAAGIIVGGASLVSMALPHPATAAEETQVAKAARDAILVEGTVAQFDASWPKYGLTEGQKAAFRARMTRDLRKTFTGDLLTAKLSLNLGWLEPASQGNAGRVLEFRVETFIVNSVTVQGDSATLKATYRTYFKHAQISEDKKTDEMWGAWATYDATFSLQRVNGSWLVSGLAKQETAEEADSSLPQVTAPLDLQLVPNTTKPPVKPMPVRP
jgi:hypothetical protein